MKWTIKKGDILLEPADVLICSANISLHLSGGVGGEILRRYGNAMQKELHGYLVQEKIPHVLPGTVVSTSGGGTNFRMVLHAVAIDGFYNSNAELIQSSVQKALEMAASKGTRRVALTALATGYGRLTMSQFASAIQPLLSINLPPIEEVIICVLKDSDVAELNTILQEPKLHNMPPKPNLTDLTDRFAGLLIGMAVGDAIGLPRESLSKQRAFRLFGGPPLRHRLIFGRGMYSDDTEHACMTAGALLVGWTDPQRFARSLAWKLRGWFLSLSPGIGMATAQSCLKLLLGWPVTRSGVFSAGNGPAMRAPVIGTFLADRLDLLSKMVRMSTRLTHTDPRAEEGAWIVARAAAYAIKKIPAQLDAEEFFQSVLPSLQGGQLKQYLLAAGKGIAQGLTAAEFVQTMGWNKGVSGYINHTVPTVIFCWLRYRGNFRQTVEEIVLLGGDTDTTGAIVGALTGASVGLPGIPRDWMDGLWEWPRDVEWLQRLAEQLAQRQEKWDSPCRIRPPRLFWPGILLRNMFFFLIVLVHGFRRIFPPYGTEKGTT